MTDSKAVPFVHLGARSEVSLGESMARVEELCWEASRDEQGWLALTDVNSLGRAPAFAVAAAQAGLRPLYGAELNVLPFGEAQYRGLTYRVRLMVENAMGWKTLLRLVTAARSAESHNRPAYLSMARVLEDARGLVLIVGGPRGELTQLLRNGDFERIETLLTELLSYYDQQHLFLELPDLRAADGQTLAVAMENIGQFFGVGTVAIPEVIAAHPADDAAFRLLCEPGEQPRRRLKDVLRPIALRSHLLTRTQAAERYAAFPDAMARTLSLAQQCAGFVLPVQEKRFPIHDFCRGVDAESFIWNTVFSKASERYGDLPTRYKERLNREFQEIVEAGLANAIVSLVRLREELEIAGVQRGPGAGLFTNSLVASLLGLTRLDPLHFDLNFELSPGLAKGAFPLLELAIPANQEGLAVGCMAKLFRDQVSPVGEWVGWKSAQVIERVAPAIGFDGKWATNLTRQATWQKAREAARKQPPTWTPAPESGTDSPEVMAWLAERWEGRARQLRPSPGLYTFSVEAVDATVPQRLLGVGAGQGEGLPLTEWNSEELGRLRHGRLRFAHPPLLDLIGEATSLARSQGDLQYSPENTPADDPATYRFLCEGETVGVHPIEGPWARQRLRSGQPQDLPQLIKLFSGLDAKSGAPDLAGVLLSHVCAAIKSQKPLAFYAASLSQVCGDRRRTAQLLAEIRQRGIRIAPIDVNYCGWRWTVEKDALRPGFITIHGMTPAASQELIDKRRELHFADVAELLHRTDRARLKPTHVRALLRSGALDDLAESRPALERELETLLPGVLGRRGPSEENLAFFDRDGEWWLREQGPVPGLAPEDPLSPAEREARRRAEERETIGFNRIVLPTPSLEAFLATARVRRVIGLTPRDAGQIATLEGIVGLVQSDPRDAGTMLVDLGGCLVRARGEWGDLLESDAIIGRRVVATGVLAREGLQWRLDVDRLATIEDAEQRCREGSQVIIDLSHVPESNWKPLLAALKSFRGRTPVVMEWLPAEAPRVLRQIASRRIALCPGLEAALDRYVGAGSWKPVVAPGALAEPERGWRALLERTVVPLLRQLRVGIAKG